jgi:hypothetical protein
MFTEAMLRWIKSVQKTIQVVINNKLQNFGKVKYRYIIQLFILTC